MFVYTHYWIFALYNDMNSVRFVKNIGGRRQARGSRHRRRWGA